MLLLEVSGALFLPVGEGQLLIDCADDFEVSIFLTETSTSHAMLTKQKTFSTKPKLQSNTKKLTDWMGGANTDTAIRVDEGDEVPAVLLEEDDEEMALKDIPEVDTAATRSRGKRPRSAEDNDEDDENEHIFVQSEEDEEEDLAPRRRKKTKVVDEASKEEEDKKKLGINTAYEGFSIYGRILCLIVKRKGVKKSAGGNMSGTQMLENWVSTQADNEGALDDAEDG
jgi:Zn-dependent metalloprotease